MPYEKQVGYVHQEKDDFIVTCNFYYDLVIYNDFYTFF